MTQPFQVLWLLGVQVAAVQTPGVHAAAVQTPDCPGPNSPRFRHCSGKCSSIVYCDFVQALLPVQLLWVVSPGFEQVLALVQLLWVVLPEIEQVPAPCRCSGCCSPINEHVPAPVQLLWLV